MHHFAWKCSYLSLIEYRVTDETGSYLAEIREGFSDYERSICNGPDVVRDCLASVGMVYRVNGHGPDYSRAMPAATVAAFNAWRAARHAEALAKMRADPYRYGEISDSDYPAPIEALRGDYVTGKGWIALPLD